MGIFRNFVAYELSLIISPGGPTGRFYNTYKKRPKVSLFSAIWALARFKGPRPFWTTFKRRLLSKDPTFPCLAPTWVLARRYNFPRGLG